MITDKLLEVATIQAVTAAAVSTNAIDRGSGTADVAEGEPLELWARIPTAADGGVTFLSNTGGLTIEAISATDAALTAGIVTHCVATIPLANLVVGNMYRIGVLMGPTKRYIGARFTPVTASATAGKVTAWFQPRGHAQANPPSLT